MVGEHPGASEHDGAGDDLHTSPADLEELRATVRDLEAIRWEVQEDRQVVTRLALEVARGRLDEAARLVSAVEKRAINHSRAALASGTRAPARRRAVTVVAIGSGVVLIFGTLSSFVLIRYLRERRRGLEAFGRSERLVALGAVAASMAHELNSPLGTIGGCASAVRSRLERDDEPRDDEIEYLRMIESETHRCSGIVGSLRDLVRDAPLAVTSSRLDRIVHEVVRFVKVGQDVKQIDFRVDAEADVEILCDPDKIKQLLLNLLLNARDASDEGDQVRVQVGSHGEGVALIAVSDDGKGIRKKDLPQIFHAFYTEKSTGLGFGLFLCERIAALHGGSIRAESEGPGRGARFEVFLPTG